MLIELGELIRYPRKIFTFSDPDSELYFIHQFTYTSEMGDDGMNDTQWVGRVKMILKKQSQASNLYLNNHNLVDEKI